jgi:hypothetical protein
VKKIIASFRTWRNPYRVKWLTNRAPIEKHKLSVYAVSFYDKQLKEDIEIIPIAQKLEWTILKVSGTKDQYDVTADGTITLELDDDMHSRLRKSKYLVDHQIDFRFKDVMAESGEDFELVENSNIQLDIN